VQQREKRQGGHRHSQDRVSSSSSWSDMQLCFVLFVLEVSCKDNTSLLSLADASRMRVSEHAHGSPGTV
jgi:hypothetical protein